MTYSFMPLLDDAEIDLVELKESKSESESECEFKIEVFFDNSEFVLNNSFLDLNGLSKIHDSDLFICKQSFTEIVSPPPEV